MDDNEEILPHQRKKEKHEIIQKEMSQRMASGIKEKV